MNKIYDEIYSKLDALERGRYDGCQFINCVFQGLHFHDYEFTDCIFTDCDMSNIKVGNTSFKAVEFNGCKMIGIDFTQCNSFLLKMDFIDCQMDYSVFEEMKLESVAFKQSKLQHVDFSFAALTNIEMIGCDLLYSVFNQSNLKEADLSDSYNITINPANNNLVGCKIPRIESINLLAGHKIDWV